MVGQQNLEGILENTKCKSLVPQMIKSLQCRRPGFKPWVRKIFWRRKWHPAPVFLPGKSHGWRSLAGYSPWGHKELDMTEQLTHTLLPEPLSSPLSPHSHHVFLSADMASVASGLIGFLHLCRGLQ